MAKQTVRVVKAFGIYNAGDVITLSSDESRAAGANVRPIDAPGANRLGPAPSSLRDVVSDGDIKTGAGGAAPTEAELVTAPPKRRSSKKRE